MAEMVTTERDPSNGELRRFGLLVGGVFLGLGLWWMFRHRYPVVAPWFAGGGGLLVLLGLVAPRALLFPHRFWMALAELMGSVMTRVILALIFFGVVTPIGLVKRLLGHDLLDRVRRERSSHWVPLPPQRRHRRHYDRMF
jgi:hypothetical protein